MSVLVLAEHDQSRLSPTTARLVAAASELGPVELLVAGQGISAAAREGAAYGMQSTDQSKNLAGIQAAALADAPTIWGVAPTVNAPNPARMPV